MASGSITEASNKNKPSKRPTTVKTFGLTGGIASGKSSIAAILRGLGAVVIDADKVARQIVAPGSSALQEIRQTFGDQFITQEGTLDRKRLGALAFSDKAARDALSAITHPRIAQQMSAEAKLAKERGAPVVFLEAALLFEANWDQGLDGVWVVSIPEEVQLKRLQLRDAYNEAQAQARLAAQMPLAEKLQRATLVIDNSRSLEETTQIVTKAYQALVAGETV
jgi:dephospho-CoA kinase